MMLSPPETWRVAMQYAAEASALRVMTGPCAMISHTRTFPSIPVLKRRDLFSLLHSHPRIVREWPARPQCMYCCLPTCPAAISSSNRSSVQTRRSLFHPPVARRLPVPCTATHSTASECTNLYSSLALPPWYCHSSTFPSLLPVTNLQSTPLRLRLPDVISDSDALMMDAHLMALVCPAPTCRQSSPFQIRQQWSYDPVKYGCWVASPLPSAGTGRRRMTDTQSSCGRLLPASISKAGVYSSSMVDSLVMPFFLIHFSKVV
mmetsp:Transcript_12942/g.23548  ORF Transcript_12942/g.23548 Transcript_12942/m.23548 type:complete len:261 (-) Transcript_12942:287-1069(-)